MVTVQYEPDFVIHGNRVPAWTVIDDTGSLLTAFPEEHEARAYAADYEAEFGAPQPPVQGEQS